jgi:proteasome-associated ATPase
MVLQRSSDLAHYTLKTGDEVRVDSNYRMALEMLSSTKAHEHYLDTVPELPWEKVGGQETALQAIKDAIELPLLHPDLFKKFQHATPKGFLLYGPPGCGKTLIGKATAYNLTKQLGQKTGAEMREYFMHVKGPEILNMWVGESERMVREIFATAREKRNEGFMPFLFIDEAESILGTRRASRHSNILSTLVPMFCSEMDGIDSLNDVVIILASNRADLIDPAILRPGRIDRKIKVNRPDKQGSRDIYRIYLTDDLPYDGVLAKEADGLGASIERLIERFTDWQFARRDENKFLEVTLRSGRKDILYRSDRDQRRNHRFDRGTREGNSDQTGHCDSARAGNSGSRPATRVQCRVRGERYLSHDGHHRRLAQADRLRSRKRGEDLPSKTSFRCA